MCVRFLRGPKVMIGGKTDTIVRIYEAASVISAAIAIIVSITPAIGKYLSALNLQNLVNMIKF